MIKKVMVRSIAYLTFILLFFTGCQQNQLFSETQLFQEEGWHKDSIATFKLPILDTVATHQVFINTRNTNAFKFSNLYLIAKLNYPNGKQKIDTLQYLMAKPNGEWLGVGATSVKENKLWYLQDFQFNETGIYSIDLRHAMRKNGEIDGLNYLEGVLDIGIQIETTNK